MKVAIGKLRAAPDSGLCDPVPGRLDNDNPRHRSCAVVRNENSGVSQAVADDYAKRRAIKNVLSVRCQDSAAPAGNETISFTAYQQAIEKPIRTFLAAHANIDFIVLTKGIPIRIARRGRGLPPPPSAPTKTPRPLPPPPHPNPTPPARPSPPPLPSFRLRSSHLAVQPMPHPWPQRRACPPHNADMQRAADILRSRSVPVELTQTDVFAGKRTGLLGYVSWGSNDRHYDAAAYHSLRFAPGLSVRRPFPPAPDVLANQGRPVAHRRSDCAGSYRSEGLHG